MKLNFAGFFALVLLFICIGAIQNLKAQNDESNDSLSVKIDDVTKKLNLKLLLTKEQSAQVQKILVENISKSSFDEEKSVKAINEKVQSVLTKKQRTKFEILKSNWLNELFDTSEKK